MEAHDPVPWRQGPTAEFEEALIDSFESEPGPDGADLVRWTCPRCRHPHVQTVERDGQWAGLAAASSPRSGELAIRCDCRQEHADRPDDSVGCGFRTVVTIEEEDS